MKAILYKIQQKSEFQISVLNQLLSEWVRTQVTITFWLHLPALVIGEDLLILLNLSLILEPASVISVLIQSSSDWFRTQVTITF